MKKYTGRVMINVSLFFDPIVDAEDEESAFERLINGVDLKAYLKEAEEVYWTIEDSNIEIEDITELS